MTRSDNYSGCAVLAFWDPWATGFAKIRELPDRVLNQANHKRVAQSRRDIAGL